ncbi:hypothetical protein Tco_0304725 [Tanacetum coccineum]
MAPAPDSETAYHETIDKYNKSVNFEQEVACLMLSSMSPDQQRTLEKFNAYDMLKELKTMFEEQPKAKCLKTVKTPKRIGKTIVEPHAMLKLHEKGIPNKAETPDVLAIREGRIHEDK